MVAVVDAASCSTPTAIQPTSPTAWPRSVCPRSAPPLVSRLAVVVSAAKPAPSILNNEPWCLQYAPDDPMRKELYRDWTFTGIFPICLERVFGQACAPAQ